MNDDELKSSADINPDALEAVFEESIIIEEDEIEEIPFIDENDTTPDIAFQANDEDYW
jgi:hypothetical protein